MDIREKLSAHLKGVSEVLKALRMEPIVVRDSIRKEEAAYLDAVGIRDTGEPGSIRKKIESVWRIEQYSGRDRFVANFSCCFIIVWFLVLGSRWIGSAYAENMVRITCYLVVLSSFYQVWMGVSSIRAWLSPDPDSLFVHDVIYGAYPKKEWIIWRLVTRLALPILCYFGGVVEVIPAVIAGVAILSGTEMFMRDAIEKKRLPENDLSKKALKS
jgi:hypothetical protein